MDFEWDDHFRLKIFNYDYRIEYLWKYRKRDPQRLIISSKLKSFLPIKAIRLLHLSRPARVRRSSCSTSSSVVDILIIYVK